MVMAWVELGYVVEVGFDQWGLDWRPKRRGELVWPFSDR